MRKTNFTFLSTLCSLAFMLFFSNLMAQQATHQLAGLCEVEELHVNNGDIVMGAWQIGDCVDNFGSGIALEPGYYHCKSITHIMPQAGKTINLKFLQNFSIGFANDRFVTGRLMILDGYINENLANTSCTGRITSDIPVSGTIASSEDILFDSQRDGHNFSTAQIREFSGTRGFTVMLMMFSTDLATVPLEITIEEDHTDECKLNCNDLVNISLGSNGKRGLTPFDVMNGLDAALGCHYVVEVAYPYASFENMYPNKDTVDCWMVGGEYIYRVIDTITQNSCWGYIKVEDKFPPQITCEDDTIHCWEAENFGLVATSDNCGYEITPQELSKRWYDYDCDSALFIGYIERSVLATDQWGNTFQCDSQRLYILREYLDSLVCIDSLYTIECCQDSIDSYNDDVEDLWEDELVWYDEWGYAHPKVLIEKDPTKEHSTYSKGLVPPPYIQHDGWIGHLDSDEPNDENSYNPYGKCNIVAHYKDHIIPTCGTMHNMSPKIIWTYKIRREWIIYDWCEGRDTTCIQWIKIVDKKPPVVDHPKDITTTIKPHDCKAHVELIPPVVTEECGLKWVKNTGASESSVLNKIRAIYTIRYFDKDHPGKETVITNEMGLDETEIIYLPAGWFHVDWVVRDPCWNEAYAENYVYAYDNTPPSPICDEITQVTLDPKECWARVDAIDLDDGSHDNCCDKLHYAVASMDSIEYYRNYWADVYKECYGEYYYHHYKPNFDDIIEKWINCYVFNDYIDLSECGTDTVVMRVYEACGLPLYDPHIFAGTKHQWFCFNLYDDYACFFKIHYDEFAHYQNPRPELGCEYDNYVYDSGCDCNMIPTGVTTSSDFENGHGGDDMDGGCENGEHMPFHNRVCCDYQYDSDHPYYNKWKELQKEYPELPEICDLRYYFQHKYNDCMVEIRKDDKVAPVCEVPDDVIYYCDGVPYEGSLKVGTVTYDFSCPQFAHDVCYASDILASTFNKVSTHDNYCGGSRYVAQVDIDPDGWDVAGYGYYHGPHYNYGYYDCHDLSIYDHDEHSAKQLWKPIYCSIWLLLDQYDDPSYAKPDPYQYFGTPTVFENCWTYTIDSVDSGELDECGVGTLTRTWTITDKCDNSTTCYQRVYIKPRSDFEVKFPEDVLVDCNDGFDITPTADGAGYPTVKDDDCELIGINYKDQEFDINDEACRKILRTWTVIDWCVYDPDIHSRHPEVIVNDTCVAGPDRPCVIRNLKDDGDGYMTYLQVIKIIDGVPPVVVCADDYTACIYDEDCDQIDVVYELGSATDACIDDPEDFQYRYVIDAFGEGETFIYGHGNVLDETLPVGSHPVYLIARDLCGNEDSCHLTIDIIDCKKPTPYCYNGIATVIMPYTGEVTVWACDLDAGSYDNCTDMSDLRFTFSEIPPEDDSTFTTNTSGFANVCAGGSSSRVFSCADLGEQTVTVYVWDDEGNFDFCETYLLIQPGENACQDSSGNFTTVTGSLATETAEAVEFAKVTFNASRDFTTGVDGKFAFSGVSMNQSFDLTAERNDEADNGVSTLDLVFIQKHILGIQKLDSPYKMIAADINNSSSVTALDLVELRKLILGIYNEFPNNTSWRFVDKAYEFADATKPWGFAESITISGDKVDGNDFVGVKIGDVNETAIPHSLLNAQIRNSADKLTFQIEEQAVEAGQEVIVDVYGKNFNNIEGYQFTMNLTGLQFADVVGASLDMTEDNFGILTSDKTLVTTSWNSSRGTTSDDALFTLKFIATEGGQLSDLIDLTSTVTKAEAYNGNGIMGVALEFTQDNKVIQSSNYALYQNNPNPFDNESLIGFTLPENGEATLKIIDVTGKVLKLYQGDFNKGYNQIRVAKKDIAATGVLYYQLESGDFVATKKMILID